MRNLTDSQFLKIVRESVRGKSAISPEQLLSQLEQFSADLKSLVETERSMYQLLRRLKLVHIELCSSYRYLETGKVTDDGFFLTVLWNARSIVEVEIEMTTMLIEHPGIAGEVPMPESPIFWSRDYTVTDLMELIVALHSCGALVNRYGSRASLAGVVRILEQAFNVQVKDYFGLKANLTSRKIKITKFLDVLSSNFVNLCDR